MVERLQTDDLDDDVEQEPLYLAFHMGPENYLVSVDSVAEVIRVPKLVPVPDVPDYIPGVVNLRGRVVPIVDLAIRFGLSGAEGNQRPVIIVVRCDDDQIGLMVEGVKRVLSVPDAHIDRNSLTDRKTSVIEGVAATDAGDFLVIEVPRLIADCRPQEVSA